MNMINFYTEMARKTLEAFGAASEMIEYNNSLPSANGDQVKKKAVEIYENRTKDMQREEGMGTFQIIDRWANHTFKSDIEIEEWQERLNTQLIEEGHNIKLIIRRQMISGGSIPIFEVEILSILRFETVQDYERETEILKEAA